MPNYLFIVLVSTQLLFAATSSAKELTFVSTGDRDQGFGYVGGSSCCDCRTEYHGFLPSEFREAYTIHSVTFYLANSYENSHYTKQDIGPTKLTLILDGSIRITAITQRTPSGTSHRINTPWFIRFDLKLPVPVRPNMSWRLIDGDDNIYSAAILHSSNTVRQGLPGTHRTYGCSYKRTEPGWFSASFELGGHATDRQERATTDQHKDSRESIKNTKSLVSNIWSVEFADPAITSGFKGRRYFRFATNTLSHTFAPTIDGITFDRIMHGFVSKSDEGPWTHRFDVYIPENASKTVQDTAVKFIRMLLHLYWYGIEYLDQQPFHQKPVTQIWLHPKLPEGVLAPIASQINEHLVFWGIDTWISKAPSVELLRVVTHEYSHMVVKGSGQYDTNSVEGEYGATEAWAGGYLGERLFVRWLQLNLKNGTQPLPNEWDSMDEVWDENGISTWKGYYYTDVPVQILLDGEPTDDRIMKYWWDNKDKVVNSKRLPGFYAYIGACLWIDEIHGPEKLKKTLRWDPLKFQAALNPLLK